MRTPVQEHTLIINKKIHFKHREMLHVCILERITENDDISPASFGAPCLKGALRAWEEDMNMHN